MKQRIKPQTTDKLIYVINAQCSDCFWLSIYYIFLCLRIYISGFINKTILQSKEAVIPSRGRELATLGRSSARVTNNGAAAKCHCTNYRRLIRADSLCSQALEVREQASFNESRRGIITVDMDFVKN